MKGKRLFVFFLVMSKWFVVYADTCPTPKEIKDRKVPEAYEWTVHYELALDDLLKSTRLFSVSIENHGEFISCRYDSPRREARIDGVSKEEKCLISVESGDWFIMDNGGVLCMEEDKKLCQFKYEC